MRTSPYSLTEAQEICAELQHLTGQPYSKNHASSIDCIAVTPYGSEHRSRFMMYYLLLEDAGEALTNEYKGLLYDVVVISGSSEKTELLHESIDTWLPANKPEAMSVFYKNITICKTTY